MSDITSHPAYQATRRCLARVSDAVLFEAVTYEMDMEHGTAPRPDCPVCLVGTLCRVADPVQCRNGGWDMTALKLFPGTDHDDWITVFLGVMRRRLRPAIEAAVADELLSRV